MNTSNEKTFEIGDIAYTIDGHKVCVKAIVEDTYYVARFYTEYDYDEWDNGSQWEEEDTTLHPANRLFTEAPTHKLDLAVQDLNDRIEKLQKQEREKWNVIRDLDNKIKGRNQKLEEAAKKVDGLDPLLDLVDGNITHFAILPEYAHDEPSVRTTKEHIEKYNDKILSLYIKKDGTFSTRIHQCNADGIHTEESPANVVPCTSEEQAEACVKAWITKRLSEEQSYYTERLLSLADKWDAPIPDGLMQKIKEEKIDALTAVIEKKQEELKEKKKALREAKNL